MAVEPILITDPHDERVRDYVALNAPEERRRREGDEFFIAEGITAIERLLASDHAVRSVLLTPQKFDRLAAMLGRALTGGRSTDEVPVYVASKEVVAATVGFALHRGAIASATRRPLPTLDEVITCARRVAVLEGLNDPENLGAIARSARAFGIDALILDPTCIDPYYRRTIRVSMGEILFLPVARALPWPDSLDVLHHHGFETWALTPAATAEDLWGLEAPERLALVFGAEGRGLTDHVLARARRLVRIPIADDVDSLNVGAAAAVAMAVATRPG